MDSRAGLHRRPQHLRGSPSLRNWCVMSVAGFFATHAGGTDQTARVLVWEQMLHQALRLLGEAHSRISSASSQEKLCELDGWWRAKRQKLNGKSALLPSEEATSQDPVRA